MGEICPIGEYACPRLGSASKDIRCVPQEKWCDGRGDCEGSFDETRDHDYVDQFCTKSKENIFGPNEQQLLTTAFMKELDFEFHERTLG